MTQQATNEPDAGPGTLMRLGSAFAGSKVLLSAIELDLFTELGEDTLTRSEIEQRLGLHSRVTWEWLSLLVALGVLERDGDRYRNSALSATFLDRTKPNYSGGFLNRTNQVLFPAWVYLTDALRTGEQQAKHLDSGDMFDKPYQKPEEVEAFLTMMDSLTSAIGANLASGVDWTDVRRVTDIGGARGNLLSFVLREHEHLSGTVFDLPALQKPAAEFAARAGLTDRLSFQPGDFFVDELPKADAVIVGHVLHDWAPAERAEIMANVYRAVEPGGRVLVYDSMLDEQQPDMARLIISIHMKLMTPNGSEYTINEGTDLLAEAGFVDIQAQGLGAIDTLLIGRKPR